MTIDELNALTTLTAADEVPVWDSEERGEPTRKITASNLAASVKSLASLPSTTEMNTAIQQSTANKAAKTVLSGTTSFSALDNNSYESKALDNLHNSIASKSSGIVELESTGGPLYYTVLFKYSDIYYSGYLSTYSGSASWIVYRYSYENGTFRIYKAA